MNKELELETIRNVITWMIKNINTECLDESEKTRIDQIANECFEDLIIKKTKE